MVQGSKVQGWCDSSMDRKDGTPPSCCPPSLAWGLCIVCMPHGCMVAAEPPGLTSVFQTGRRENEMEVKAKGSFLARICLLGVEWDVLSRDCHIFFIGQKCGVCPALSAKEARELNVFSWAHCHPTQSWVCVKTKGR